MPDFITRWFLDYEFRTQLEALAQECSAAMRTGAALRSRSLHRASSRDQRVSG